MKQLYSLYCASCKQVDANGVMTPCYFNFFAQTPIDACAIANSVAKALKLGLVTYWEVEDDNEVCD